MDGMARENRLAELTDPGIDWPAGGNRNIILSQDTAIELGNPRQESVSFLLWTEDAGLLRDGRIRLVGRDLPECADMSLPFGKVILAEVDGFDGENGYDRYREMEGLRYGLDLKGYMLRAVSQYQREWSRISREAVENGFSFGVLGGALMKRFRKLPYVRAVEILFVNSTVEDVAALRPIAGEAEKIISAMNKMFDELSFDCTSCDYQEVCDDVGELRSMRESLLKKRSGDPSGDSGAPKGNGSVRGKAVHIDPGRCTGCEACLESCPFNALYMKDRQALADGELCTGCGRCIPACPEKAISGAGTEAS